MRMECKLVLLRRLVQLSPPLLPLAPLRLLLLLPICPALLLLPLPLLLPLLLLVRLLLLFLPLEPM